MMKRKGWILTAALVATLSAMPVAAGSGETAGILDRILAAVSAWVGGEKANPPNPAESSADGDSEAYPQVPVGG